MIFEKFMVEQTGVESLGFRNVQITAESLGETKHYADTSSTNQ